MIKSLSRLSNGGRYSNEKPVNVNPIIRSSSSGLEVDDFTVYNPAYIHKIVRSTQKEALSKLLETSYSLSKNKCAYKSLNSHAPGDVIVEILQKLIEIIVLDDIRFTDIIEKQNKVISTNTTDINRIRDKLETANAIIKNMEDTISDNMNSSQSRKCSMKSTTSSVSTIGSTMSCVIDFPHFG